MEDLVHAWRAERLIAIHAAILRKFNDLVKFLLNTDVSLDSPDVHILCRDHIDTQLVTPNLGFDMIASCFARAIEEQKKMTWTFVIVEVEIAEA